MINPKIKMDLAGLLWLGRSLDSRQPAVRRMLKQWAAYYSRFVRKRWANQGDGDWEPLKPSTLKKRRKEGKGAKILRDTSTLYRAMTIGTDGNHTRIKKQSVEFGFANKPHGGAENITIRELAIVHDQGVTGTGRGGRTNIPARPILVTPDEKTTRLMKLAAYRASQKLLAVGAAKVKLPRIPGV